MKFRRMVGVSVAATALVVGVAATPAWADTIDEGHVDVLDVDYENGALTLNIKTYNPAADDVDPASTILGISASSTVVVPNRSGWSCLGPAGTVFYVGPQTLVNGLLYAGWNAEDVPGAEEPIELKLVGWTLPDPSAKFLLYTTGFTPNIKFNTTAGGCERTIFPGGIGTGTVGGDHGHAVWAFSHTGTYTFTFRATTDSGAGVSSGDQTYTFQVA
jgi:surface-anchored protein